MTAVAFDTLKLARKLRDTAQMSQVQAEGVADALADAKVDILRWMFAAVIAQTALIVGLLKVWH